MMKRFNFNAATTAMLGAGLLSLMLTGCGSDGKDGEPGKPGPVGTPISKVNTLKSNINSASVDTDGFLTINFSLSDANGAAVFGLKNTDIGAVSFGRVGSEDEIEGLTDVEGQAREIWLSYFNKDKGDGLYTGSSYFQGKNCEDCLTDNQDGTYTLKLNKAIDTLGKYDYKADMVNGIYLGIKTANAANVNLVNNSFFYWQPSSDTTQAKPKPVIADETCQSCHRPGHDGELAFHGGKHVTLESCTFCHTDYNSYMKEDKDENGQVISSHKFDGSIKGMAHEIHSHAFYNGIYPQSASNCQTCHQPDDNLALADAWKGDKDSATCLNCHNSPFAVPSWHWDAENSQIKEDKLNCVSCHNDPDGARGAERAHYSNNDSAQAAKTRVIFNSMTYDKASKTITANMTVKHGDTNVTLAQIDSSPYKYGGDTSAIVFNGVVKDDFLVNYQKVGYRYFSAGADGSINVTFSDGAFKVAEVMATPEVKVALSSQLHVCFDGTGTVADCEFDADGKITNSGPYVPSDTTYFNIDGSKVDATPRVQHAEMAACQQCHTTAITHRFSNDIDGCASCHNGTRDKKGDGSSNLAYIVHSKHYLYDSSGSGFFKKTDCQTCHGKDGFSLKKIAADAAPVAFGKTQDGTEQTLVSPQTAACASCHQPPYGLNETTINHIVSNGGVIGTGHGVPASEYPQVKEACSTCHTDSQLLEAHANWRFGY
ncbi:OmcA/MtrC family decaheme c-type cytochrome [Shewanella algae]